MKRYEWEGIRLLANIYNDVIEIPWTAASGAEHTQYR